MEYQQAIPTIVVSRPGVMQQALRTALSLYPGIVIVSSAGDALNALHQIVAHHPALVVIDANLLPDEVEALLVALKAAENPPRCIVFISSNIHANMMLRAGADAVLPSDSSTENLRTALQQVVQFQA
ncbi:response regulator transcription factor [Candidatus Chloroploca sp. Khr17]|uniref:response regulator transcription factor n=1 Tax=Candidatus Chloroploca sp. Khr17 TaxID=2496869 RepID=UPI00101D9E45|nr:response regulator transcription factor [Candidatus Chloroploca sp. Khr17]